MASYDSELKLKPWSFYIFGRIIWTGFVMILIMITLENNFCTWKLLCISYVFFHDEFKYAFRIALPPTIFCMTIF